ncbi:MAG TPA: hypothetical protein VNP96_04605 [Solirubrobacterales bacterium]|nr:hypothetical protein [Solirubrobacterales bacterium]
MDEAFVIMQIGDADLDAVCDAAIDPAITDAGFTPRRVDRHNAGDLLKGEIVDFIERSQIIVADITNERPNCYLEIGYAMGLGKKANLILTAREDHHHGSPNFNNSGPKVHFDLEGYDILFWDASNLEVFRKELAKRIKRRAAIVGTTKRDPTQSDTDFAWREDLRVRGESGLASVNRSAYMEVAAELRPPGSWTQPRLLDAINDASVHTFGWPIAVVLDNQDEYRPRPTSDGIVAEVAIGGDDHDRTSYDLWKLFRDGRFYTMLTLFEDERVPESIFFDTRINRITESLFLLARLYRRLEVSDTDLVDISFRHAGLAGRTLRSANTNRAMYDSRNAAEDVADVRFSTTIEELESDLVGKVKEVTQPLFMLFDFFELSDEILEEIAESFIAGSVK